MIPLPRELRQCRDCGESVLITVTRLGRYLLVDPRPDERGNQACYRVGPRVWHSRSLDAAGAMPPAAWEHRYVPHVATCKPKKPKATQEALPILPANVTRLDPKRRRRRRSR
ncbi:hypothetical protein DQ384_37990 [Sphaerisporangium album]|uniref:Uncharacterized protein n=1 Tax=Sphaerisporangium album TaxID=509200 RepID=A0A367ELY5_9ACTN|nr:hypothetical protein [Sphaerisporangium album]RCG19074.1 hypothetical protein DQ384_37990 [Sphaerisporangium album]